MQTQWTELAQQALDNMYVTTKEMAALNAKTAGKVIEHQLGVVNEVADTGLAHVKRLREAKTFEDVVKAQTELMETGVKQGVEAVRKAMGLATEVRDSYGEMFKKGVEKTVEEFKAPKKAA